ncbi:MAG: two-component regulator propeller domain-containing protein [Bacteroidales bacterium]|nr:two-component regulator propeller domain-containing protein [Bacteroidales bacterium]
MQVRKRFAFTLYLGLSCMLLALLPYSGLQAQKYALENHTLKTGLPQNTVSDIDQDPKGYIWFSTQVGVARYDGYTFEHFNFSHGLPDDEVNCILVDQSGRIWFGTQGGIGIYDGESFKQITKDKGLIDDRVDGMIEDLAGNIWIWTAYGISVITPDTILSYSKKDALTDNNVQKAFVDSRGWVHLATYFSPGITIFKDPYTFVKLPQEQIVRDIIEADPGEIWYATQGSGILVMEEGKERRLGTEDGLADEIVLSMLRDSQGRIWCGTYAEGLFIYENERFNHIRPRGSYDPIARELVEDSRGRIWIAGFDDGVWMLDDQYLKHFNIANNLVHNNVNTIFEDRFGSIWIGTMGGVSKYGRAIFEVYDLDFGLPANSIQAVYYDSQGRIWLGAHGNLVSIRGDELKTFGAEEGYPEDYHPLCFAEDGQRNVYIGTGFELFMYNGSSIREAGLKATINSLLYTNDQQLWCGTDSGVHILHQGEFRHLGLEDGLVNLKVNSMLQMDQLICCATEGGLSLFDRSGQHIRNYTEEDGLASAVCLDVACDTKNNLWVATKSRGITRIDLSLPEAVENFNTTDGMVSNSTYFVEFRDSVSLWIGTNLGINVLHMETGEFSLYGDDEGFYPLETYERAISKGEGGELWIGTVEGLVHYDPRYDIRDPNPPELVLYPPVVDGIICRGSPEGASDISGVFPGEMTFPYSKNSLEFNFTGIHTLNPSRNSFSWFLEGFDEDWSLPGNERTAPYMRLPNGHYMFRVKAFNLDGVEVEQEASFAFTIKPPLWKTFWFIFLEVLTGLALIYGTFKYRERQLIREKRILEAKVKGRTREIEAQKIEIEEKNTEITSSIQYARRIQHAVLPGKRTLEKVLPEHFIFFKPRDIVSGDFYWVEKKEELIVVCAADCTGHGVPGAFMSLLGLTFLNEIVNHEGVLKASEILNRLRSNIIRAMSHKDEAEQAKDGMDLALVVIDPQLDMLEFAGAYNPMILIRKGELIEYKGDNMPVGKHIVEERSFTNHRVQLEDRDMIYLYSDGFPDQFGGEKVGKYKARPFKNLLIRISSEVVRKQAGTLENELRNWMGEEPQVDDILVIGIRYLKN